MGSGIYIFGFLIILCLNYEGRNMRRAYLAKGEEHLAHRYHKRYMRCIAAVVVFLLLVYLRSLIGGAEASAIQFIK